ncbi:hypothetical protein [Pedobacter sp. SYSU D00535]|uniref:hypothetical protein n=1 Tax=Pedobacter sp. SYSU D00535 TaxID=2810308 RepID=UPI001A9573C0|nr:hypothetical protein [Pedobacter sp. SYSU D00535]
MVDVGYVIGKISERIPEAASQELNEAANGATPPITPAVKSAFIEIIRELSNEEFDRFLQYLLHMEHHITTTSSFYGTDEPEKLPEEIRQKLIKLEFIQNVRGWSFSTSKD